MRSTSSKNQGAIVLVTHCGLGIAAKNSSAVPVDRFLRVVFGPRRPHAVRLLHVRTEFFQHGLSRTPRLFGHGLGINHLQAVVSLDLLAGASMLPLDFDEKLLPPSPKQRKVSPDGCSDQCAEGDDKCNEQG